MTVSALPPHLGFFMTLGVPIYVQSTLISGTYRQAPRWNPLLTAPLMWGVWSASSARCLWKLQLLYVPAAFCGAITRTSATPLVWSALSVMAHTVKITIVLLQLAARAKQIPPIPPTTDGDPCPHLTLCKNCSKLHATNSPRCQFWQHHFNRFWIVEWYTKTDDLQSHVHPLTGETGTCHKAMAPRGHSRDSGKA